MPRKSDKETPTIKRKCPPASNPEARENQLISLAVDLAEKQLMEGTAFSQVITHYLKLGSTKEKIEKEILEKQKELLDAKTESLRSAQRVEELYEKALDAMRDYSGNGFIIKVCFLCIDIIIILIHSNFRYFLTKEFI